MFKGLAKDAAIYGVVSLLFRIFNFVVFLLFTYVLTIEEFGHLSLITTLVGLFGVIFIGLNNAVYRYYWEPDLTQSQQQVVVGSGFLLIIFIGIVFGAVAFALLFPLSDWMHVRYGFTWFWIFLVCLCVLPTQLIEFARNILRLQFSPWKSSLLVAMQNCMGALFTLAFVVYFKQGVKGYLTGLLLSLLILLPFALLMIRKQISFAFQKSVGKQLWRFGYPFIFSNLAYWILGSIDRWMLVELSSSTEVGMYSIALRFAMILTFVASAFGQAWSPYALKAYNENPQYRVLYSRTFSLWLYLLVLIGSAIALFSIEILMLFTAKDYWAAAPLFPFLAIGTALMGAIEVPAMGIALSQKTKILGFFSWSVVLINILLNWLLIPSLGSLGAACATFISFGILISCYIISSQRLHPLPLEWKKIAYILCLMSTYLTTSLYLLEHAWSWALFCFKVVFMLMGLAFGYWIKVLNYKESLMLVTHWLAKNRSVQKTPAS